MNAEDKSRALHALATLMLRSSGLDVPAPMPLLNEQAKASLSDEALNVWNNILIELNNVKPSEGKIISRLLMNKFHRVSELAEMNSKLMDDSKATLDFVRENDQYRLSEDEISHESIFGDFDKLFE